MAEQPQNLKFLASQIPCIPQDMTEDFDSEFIGNTNVSSEDEPKEAMQCLGSHNPKAKTAENNVGNEGDMAEQHQNLKFLASHIPKIPQDITEDFPSAEEHPA